jgi:hypothetical protein
MWRVGRKVPLNVYDDDRPVCQCHSANDARRIVAVMNAALYEAESVPSGRTEPASAPESTPQPKTPLSR